MVIDRRGGFPHDCGVMNKWLYLFCRGGWQRYKVGQYGRIVRRANRLEASLTPRSMEELKGEVKELHSRAQTAKSINHLLPEALALGRELSRRTLNIRH